MKKQNIIKELREAQHLNQKQLADRMGITPASYSKFESGISNYTQQFLEKLAKVTKTKLIISFVSEDGPQPTPKIEKVIAKPVQVVEPVKEEVVVKAVPRVFNKEVKRASWVQDIKQS